MDIVHAGIGAADAARLLSRALRVGVAAENAHSALRVVAAGKASAAMARTATQWFGSRIRDIVVADPSNAGHPVPDAGSERAGRRALEMAGSMAAAETLLVLLSGGASALMAVPAAGVTLADKQDTTRVLLQEGAEIHALNAVRKHLSAVKGGWLAARARGACRALVVSDVVGDDLTTIGSGPTVPDASTYADALSVLDAYGGRGVYRDTVVTWLVEGVRGEHPETPKPGDARLARSQTSILGGRRDAMEGAAARARALGYDAVVVDEPTVGEARAAARSFVRDLARRTAGRTRPLAVIASGETTVRVVGSGTGGRNQEFVLAAAEQLPRVGVAALLASVGTDGVDGPTAAAGALADETTITRAGAAGLDAHAFLENNDAGGFFHAIDGLIHTGPTGTNVGDLQVVLLA